MAADLRQETKRTDLPNEVIRLMAEAYATICEQERTISRLESQYNVMHRMHDKEVALKGEAQEQVATLTAERDEARREGCEREASDRKSTRLNSSHRT